jgi:hypothetical protein
LEAEPGTAVERFESRFVVIADHAFDPYPYEVVLKGFQDGRLSFSEARILYFALFLRDPAPKGALWPTLNEVFYALEEHSDINQHEVNQMTIRSSVAEALAALKEARR